MKITPTILYTFDLKGAEVLIIENALHQRYMATKTKRFIDLWHNLNHQCGNCHFKQTVKVSFSVNREQLRTIQSALILHKAKLKMGNYSVDQEEKMINIIRESWL